MEAGESKLKPTVVYACGFFYSDMKKARGANSNVH